MGNSPFQLFCTDWANIKGGFQLPLLRSSLHAIRSLNRNTKSCTFWCLKQVVFEDANSIQNFPWVKEDKFASGWQKLLHSASRNGNHRTWKQRQLQSDPKQKPQWSAKSKIKGRNFVQRNQIIYQLKFKLNKI